MHCGAGGDPEEADEGPSPCSPHPAGQSLHPFLGKQTGARGWGEPVRVELVGVRGRRWALWAGWPGGRAAGPLQRGCGLWDGRAHLSPAREACPHTESSHRCLTLVFISQMGTWF